MSRSTLDGFKSRNSIIKKAFHLIINISFKNPYKTCKYYHKEIDHNTIRLLDHLNKYKLYRDNKPLDKPAKDSQQTLINLIIIILETKNNY